MADKPFPLRTDQQRRFGLWVTDVNDYPHTAYFVFVRKAFGRSENAIHVTRWGLN